MGRGFLEGGFWLGVGGACCVMEVGFRVEDFRGLVRGKEEGEVRRGYEFRDEYDGNGITTDGLSKIVCIPLRHGTMTLYTTRYINDISCSPHL